MDIEIDKEKLLQDYLDECIKYWRKADKKGIYYAEYYIDAYQSVRTFYFGKTLENDKEKDKEEE